MPASTADVGKKLLQEMKEWASLHTLPIVNGHVPRGAGLVSLDMDETRDLFPQLRTVLEVVDPYLVVVEPFELTTEDLEGQLELLVARDTEPSQLESVRARFQFVGQLESLAISVFIKNGPVVLEYHYLAPWSDDTLVEEMADFVRPPLDPEAAARIQAQQDERDRWAPAACTEAARRIALDPRFPKAKTEAARVFLARDVLGTELPRDQYMVKEIGREAKAIFDFEIGPKK